MSTRAVILLLLGCLLFALAGGFVGVAGYMSTRAVILLLLGCLLFALAGGFVGVAGYMSTRAVILLLLGCLLFALAGGFVARQISLTRFAAEERANLEAQAITPAPTRVLSEAERVPTWTPTSTITPTPTATYTPTATATPWPTATPPTVAPRSAATGTGLNFDSWGGTDTGDCYRKVYEAAVDIFTRHAREAGRSVNYVPFDCMRFVQAYMVCSYNPIDGSHWVVNTYGTLRWTTWTKANGMSVTWQDLEMWRDGGIRSEVSCFMPLMEQ